jgi:hypothetical protein
MNRPNAKPSIPIKKPAVPTFDEFNPNYNGVPKYKPFVNMNEYQNARPA